LTQGTDQEAARKLLETVSLELDTDLRLHPQKLELGRAELLTDALTLPFADIEARLTQYLSDASGVEKMMLQKTMKAYLAKLNANPLIPLNFRLKVLSTFERDLELFDAEMTAAVLNAHKIGVELVQKAARSESGYYRILVDMVSNALELAVKMLRLGLEKYQAPAVITTRQSFDLMRLGLVVLPALPPEATEERTRLQKIVCNHEMLRMLDFFGKSTAEQKIVWNELQHHVGSLEAHLVRKGNGLPKLEGHTFLVSSIVKPNSPGNVLTTLPPAFQFDAIVIGVDYFIDRLVTAVNRVETVLHDPRLQKKDLFTEESLHTTIVGGNAILQALRNQQRSSERQDYSGTRIIIEWRAAKAFTEAHTLVALDDYEFAPSERINPAAWSIVNISSNGVGLERISDAPIEVGVGAIIGLSWIPHRGEPVLGEIKWVKQPKPGEQRLGIEFVKKKYALYKGVLLGGATEEMGSNRSWPVLVRAGKPHHQAIFPDNRIFRNMVFLLSGNSKSAHFKVAEIIRSGPNYALCRIDPVAELTESGKRTLKFDV